MYGAIGETIRSKVDGVQIFQKVVGLEEIKEIWRHEGMRRSQKMSILKLRNGKLRASTSANTVVRDKLQLVPPEHHRSRFRRFEVYLLEIE